MGKQRYLGVKRISHHHYNDAESISESLQNVLVFSECCYLAAGLFVTPWTVARQASLSKGFPKQEYWSGLPFFFSPGDLPHQRISCIAGVFFATEPPGKPHFENSLIRSW